MWGDFFLNPTSIDNKFHWDGRVEGEPRSKEVSPVQDPETAPPLAVGPVRCPAFNNSPYFSLPVKGSQSAFPVCFF